MADANSASTGNIESHLSLTESAIEMLSEIIDDAVWINGNWRLTFTFENGDAFLVDYQDYH